MKKVDGDLIYDEEGDVQALAFILNDDFCETAGQDEYEYVCEHFVSMYAAEIDPAELASNIFELTASYSHFNTTLVEVDANSDYLFFTIVGE